MSQRPQRPGRGVYWRRRATVLVSGLALIALPLWAVTGFPGLSVHASGATAHGSRGTAVMRRAAASRSAASSRASTRRSWRSASKAGSRASSRAGRQGSAGPSGHAGSGGRGAAGGTSPGSPPVGLAPACPARQVVLSVAASHGSYGPGSEPQFQVYVVSLNARACSVDVGGRYLTLVIKAGGTRRVWGSADCASHAGAQFVQLAQGVPQVLHFSWDRKDSAPGCHQAGTQARPGTYTATAVAPTLGLTSRGTIFVLSGPGVGMP